MLSDEEDQKSASVARLEDVIPARLREIRRTKRLTLLEIAERCGTTPQTIQRLETGVMTMSVTWIRRLCDALQVSPFTLFMEADYSHVRRRQRFRTEIAAMQSSTREFAKTLAAVLRQVDRLP